MECRGVQAGDGSAGACRQEMDLTLLCQRAPNTVAVQNRVHHIAFANAAKSQACLHRPLGASGPDRTNAPPEILPHARASSNWQPRRVCVIYRGHADHNLTCLAGQAQTPVSTSLASAARCCPRTTHLGQFEHLRVYTNVSTRSGCALSALLDLHAVLPPLRSTGLR